MFSRSLLLVLLGLSCLQSFTMAQGASGASLCCFEFHKRPLPAANIVSYQETRSDCSVPGVIFTTKKGFRVCVDPEVDWVKQVIQSKAGAAEWKDCSCVLTAANGAGLCCFEFHKRPLPAAYVVSYEETRFDCPLPGNIFTTRKGFHVCVDPEEPWVKQVIQSKTKT